MQSDSRESQQESFDRRRKQGANLNSYLLAGIIILFLIPLFYLFYSRSKEEKAPESQATTVQQPTAVEALEQAATANPNLQNLIDLGIAYQKNGMAHKSIGVLKRATVIDPKSAVAFNDLGVGYIMIKQFGQGEIALKKSIELAPDFQLAKNNLDWLNAEKKNFIAEIEKKEAIPADQRNAQFYIDLGLMYFAVAEYQKSIDVFNQCLAIDPKNSLAYNNMGTSYMFMNKYQQAIDSFSKAIELDPNMQLYKNNVKWAQDELNKSQTPATGG